MANYKTCRLCFKSVLLQNVNFIKEVETEILDALLIKLDLSISETPLICNSCWDEIQNIFDFKSKCIQAVDSLVPLFQSGDVEEIINIKQENGQSSRICRLCLNITTVNFKFGEDDQALFNQFLPEVDLIQDVSMAICTECYHSLQNYFSFAKLCLEWENKLKIYVNKVGLRKKRKFCLDNFKQNIAQILESESYEQEYPNVQENLYLRDNKDELDIKHEVMEVADSGIGSINDSDSTEEKIDAKSYNKDENCNAKEWKCGECSFATKSKSYIKQHELLHKGIRKEGKVKETQYKCSVCSFTSNSKSYLNKHELLHTGGRKKYKCPECPLETIYRECLSKHLDVVHNHNSSIFKCNDCDFQTKHKISIQRHVENHRFKDMLSCNSCNFQTKNPKTLELHVCKVKKIPRLYPCELCDYKSNKNFSLQQHRKLTHNIGEQEIFHCYICSFFTNRKSVIKKHVRAHATNSKSNLYKCPHCDFKTFDAHCLKKHVSVHQDSMEIDVSKCIFEKYEVHRKFKCSECDAAFVRKRGLLTHSKIHLEERSFKCPLCPFKARTEKVLSGHKTVHKIPNLKCELCNYKTKTNQLLKLHMRKHQTDVETYKCKLCLFESKWASSYNTHMLSAHLGKIFSCEKCDFQTAHRRTIISHRQIHNKDNMPTLKCFNCDFSTKRKDSLRFHMLVHKPTTEIKMFKCTLCPFETKYRRSLRNHIRDKHENGNNAVSTPKGAANKEDKCEKTSTRKRKGGNKVFSCDQCSYTTTVKHYVSQHRKWVHDATELHKCNKCEFTTKYPRSLKNHISNLHEKWEVVDKSDHKEIKKN